MSERKRQEMRCFRGPRCRFDAFVSGRDVAVRSMRVFSLFCTEAAARSTKTCFRDAFFSQFLHIKSDKIFPYVMHCVAAILQGILRDFARRPYV